jgi:transposase-like protein
MIIVPVGKVYMQVNLSQDMETYFDSLYRELGRNNKEIVQRCLEGILDEEINQLLKRKRHSRRIPGDEKQVVEMKCCKCGSQKRSDFRRNGHYPRNLGTNFGHLCLMMPQVECQCGGGVWVTYKTIQRRQRIWRDLEAEFRNAYGYGLSLRQIRARCGKVIGRTLGLRSINQQVHEVAGCLPLWRETKIGDPPPVVRMDGIWVTVMKPTGEQKKDKKGRNRQVKTGKRIPILVAQGVWPGSGRQEVIGWVIAAGETQEGWEDLAFQLRQKGVYLEDIQLLIADGSSGLEALLQKKYPEVPFRDYKLNFVQKAAHIWDADDECEATRRLRAFVQKWQDCQPKATAILNDGFDLTITYYRIMEQAAQKGELWPAQLLRTTSQLERENRCIRRRMDAAVLFHSEIGLSASLYLNQIFCQSMRSSPMPGNWSQQIEQQIAESKCFLS